MCACSERQVSCSRELSGSSCATRAWLGRSFSPRVRPSNLLHSNPSPLQRRNRPCIRSPIILGPPSDSISALSDFTLANASDDGSFIDPTVITPMVPSTSETGTWKCYEETHRTEFIPGSFPSTPLHFVECSLKPVWHRQDHPTVVLVFGPLALPRILPCLARLYISQGMLLCP